MRASIVYGLCCLLGTAAPSFAAIVLGGGSTVSSGAVGVTDNTSSVSYGTSSSSDSNAVVGLSDTASSSTTVSSDTILFSGTLHLGTADEGISAYGSHIGAEYFLSVDQDSTFTATVSLESSNPQGVSNAFDYTIITIPAGPQPLTVNAGSSAADYNYNAGSLTGTLFAGAHYQIDIGASLGSGAPPVEADQNFAASLHVTPLPEPACVMAVMAVPLMLARSRRKKG